MLFCTVNDDLFKKREPQRQAAGIYFVTPCPASVARIAEDWMNPRAPIYGSAHIFFTSKLSPQLLGVIKSCPGLLARLRALAEVKPPSEVYYMRHAYDASGCRGLLSIRCTK